MRLWRSFMKKVGLLIILAVIVYSFFLFFKEPAEVAGKPIVAATIFPIADIVRQIGGEQINVVQIIPGGSSEHFFELTPTLAAQINQAQTIFYIGYGLDDWIKGVTANADYQQVDQGITILPFDGDEGAFDPHIWNSYENIKLMGRNILKTLVIKYPTLDRQKMENNLSRWLTKVDEAQQLALLKINTLPPEEKNILVFHDAFSYFAKELDLNIVGAYESVPGREPSPQELVELQKIIVDNGLKVIYSESQLSSAGLQSLVTDLNLQVRNLDPVGGVDERDSVINLLNYNVSQISQ